MPSPKDVYQDRALSNVSIKYSNDNFIWNRILPTFPVQRMSGKYYEYDKSNLREVESLRAPGSPSNEVGFSVTTQSYQTEDHALKEFVEDEVRDQADSALSPLVDATENTTERLMVQTEKELASTLSNTGVVSNNTTLSGNSQWSDFTNSDPIGDIRDATETVRSKIVRKPNTVILGEQVYSKLQDHPDLIERIKYSQFGATTDQIMARLFGVDQVLVGSAIENTANEGQADSLSDIWGKNAWVAYINPARRLKDVTLGYTFTYGNRMVERWREEDRKGAFVRVGGHNYDQKLVASDAIYLYKDAVA